MDLLAIAALEAFDGPPAEEKPVAGLPSLPDSQNSEATMAGIQAKVEPPAEVSADDIDPSLSLEAPPQNPLPPPPPPRLSASLANILSGASATAVASGSEQAAPPASSSPYRASVPLPIASTSSPTASTSSEVTMVYYGPPERLSEDSGLIRCICPYDDDDGFTIQCERCFAWLHGLCVDISPETVPDIYTCPLCISGGRIARQVEMRAARLQQLRKEAEEKLRRQRIKSNATTSSFASSGLGSDPAAPTSELDEEYELLARARGLAYQQSFESIFPQSTATIKQPLPPSAKPAQSPYYQSEQLPVQQHTLGPSPFLHPPPQPYPTSVPAQQQAKRASSATSNASNNNVPNAKRSKSGSPGGANLPSAGPNASTIPAPSRSKKRSNHASQPSLPSIPQNTATGPSSSMSNGLNQSLTDLPAPPPPKKRRSASAKEKESNDAPPSVLAPTSGSIATNGIVNTPSALPSGPGQVSSGIVNKDAAVSQHIQPVRKTRLAAATVTATSESNMAASAISGMKAPFPVPSASVPSATVVPTGIASAAKEGFMTENEDSGAEDRFEPWQFEYTPINYLRYADREVEQAAQELVQQYVDAERENISGNLGQEGDDRTVMGGSSRASPFGQHSRHSSARPSLLGMSSHLPGIAQASRLTSPVPSSGSSTPAYSSSGVAYALAPPCLPVILPEPPISPSEFSNKLSVKPLATSSMSLAPPACTPFSGPTCVPSLMNPYPRPTIHGVFTSTPITAGALVTFMHGEVFSGQEYRDDPINQWHDLGVMKCHTRGLAQPWDLVLDQRRFADESRFIRNGCHPNVFMKPVIVRKSRNNEPVGKKGRSAAKRKADQLRAVQEAGEFELVFGLYALQDIAKREELVLPFDWADDHVVHSLHTLLFSPSLVFPTIPSNVESESEDDGIPSTSSFTHLTVSQKGQIAQCTKHLYRLSRLASQTCLTLLGTSICACEKRRDCSIAWLWKIACFSESSSARSRGTIQLQDFDINGLRAACASALATDDRDWTATPGVNGRMSHKKSSKKRRADLGALVGLARGWEKPPPEPISAIPPRLASEDAAELTEQIEEAAMQIDETEEAADLLTPVHEKPGNAFNDMMEGDAGYSKSVPTSAELEKADVPFQFVAPDLNDQKTLQPSAQIDSSESKPTTASSIVVTAEALPVPTPLSTRPNTAQSATSEKQKVSTKPLTTMQADDSDSDITEPLPSDHSDAEDPAPKSVRKSPVKEMAKTLQADKRKATVEKEAKTSRSSPPKEDEMQVDEEEVVRPPKKKKALSKEEVDKSAKTKPALLKSRKASVDQQVTPAKKSLKQKALTAKKTGDGSAIKEKSLFGSLPSFRTKKEVSEKAKELAAMKDTKPASPLDMKPSRESAAVTAASSTVTASVVPPAQGVSDPISKTQLDDLFDMPVQALPIPQSKPNDAETAVADINAESPEEITTKEGAGSSASKDSQAGSSAAPVPSDTQMIIDSTTSDEPSSNKLEVEVSAQVTEEKPPPSSAPSVRRVSFQAYKKRVSTVPAASTGQEPIAEEAGITASPAGTQAPALPVESNVSTEPVLGGAVLQTPVAEKTQAEANDKATKAENRDLSAIAPSPAIADGSTPTSTASGAPGKPRLSFAAYRQRATVVPKQNSSPASNTVPLATTVPVSAATATVPAATAAVTTPEPAKATTVPMPVESTESSKPTSKEDEPRLLPAVPDEVEKTVAKTEEEQEEGEVFVDPNLEPGEVEIDAPAFGAGSALGMRMGDLHRPAASSSKESLKQSYTPPSRLRSLTPPKPPISRRADDGPSASDARQGRPTTSDGAPARRTSCSDHAQKSTASNANWESLKDRPLSPVMDRSAPESSRYSASGASPPSHPRGFSRVSPRNSFNQPLPGSKPPTGPRSNGPPWPPRGRANSTSGPAGRGPDPIYGGGFGTAGSGGSSYRPGSGGRSDGPPPPRASQPPSGPRALQGGPGFSGRGRGGRPEASRDRGWGGRGGGRGGRDRGYRGGHY